jgi:hypothetical protein
MATKRIDNGYVQFYRGSESYINDIIDSSTGLNVYGLYFSTDTGKIFFIKEQHPSGTSDVAIISSDDNTPTLFSRGDGKDSVYLISTDGSLKNSASGTLGVALGGGSTASGGLSFATGYKTTASGYGSHSIGRTANASGDYSFAGGYSSRADGSYSFGYGNYITTKDAYEFAVGKYNSPGSGVAETDASTSILFSVGCGTADDKRENAIEIRSNGDIMLKGETKPLSELLADPIIAGDDNNGTSAKLAIGQNTASALGSFVTGYQNQATGQYSHADGYGSLSSGTFSHAEGESTKTIAKSSHAEGYQTNAGMEIPTTQTRIGAYSHAEGRGTTSSGESSHAEGSASKSSGEASHAEGNTTNSTGRFSHAEGESTTAKGESSHTEGFSTITENAHEHASGRYNKSSKYSDTASYWMNTLVSIGYGTSDDKRENAIEVKANGDVYYKDTLVDFMFSKVLSKAAAIANINKCTYSIRTSGGSYVEIDGLTPEKIHESSPAEIFGIPCDITSLKNMVANGGTDKTLTTVWGDYWYTGAVADMTGVFANCGVLTSVGDISEWNVENVTTFESMFYNSSNIARVGDISKWCPKSCKSTKNMFAGTNFLGHVDFSKWWTSESSCTDMSNMFNGCENMDYIGIPLIETSTNVENMFKGCTSLTNITSCGPLRGGFTIDFSDCPLTVDGAEMIFGSLYPSGAGTIILSSDTYNTVGETRINEVINERGWTIQKNEQ